MSDLVWTEAVIGATPRSRSFSSACSRPRVGAAPRRDVLGSRRYSGSTRSPAAPGRTTAPKTPKSRPIVSGLAAVLADRAEGVSRARRFPDRFVVIAHRAIVSIGRTTASPTCACSRSARPPRADGSRDADQHAEAARVDGPVVLAPPFELLQRGLGDERDRPVLAVHTRARLVCPGETQRRPATRRSPRSRGRHEVPGGGTPEEARRHGLAELDLAVDDLARGGRASAVHPSSRSRPRSTATRPPRARRRGRRPSRRGRSAGRQPLRFGRGGPGRRARDEPLSPVRTRATRPTSLELKPSPRPPPRIVRAPRRRDR